MALLKLVTWTVFLLRISRMWLKKRMLVRISSQRGAYSCSSSSSRQFVLGKVVPLEVKLPGCCLTVGLSDCWPPCPPPPSPLSFPAKQALLCDMLWQKSSLHLLVQAMHSRDRLPTFAPYLPSGLHGQAEAEAGVGSEGSGGGGGGGGGEQVQQDQLMHGALFQVILQQLGEPLLQMILFACCFSLLDGLATMTVMLWTAN